jgi:hypothetical protein
MRTLALAAIAICALEACEPSVPPVPLRNVDYSVTTMASTADRRFMVEFRSLSNHELCISAGEWPSAQGELSANRSAGSGNEVHHVGPHDSLIAFVRFDQVPPGSRTAEGARQVDFALQPFFCASEALP